MEIPGDREGLPHRKPSLTMPTLSVALITYNEEGNLARTLASVSWADQIIVVDSGSTDRTQEIARSFNATITERPWPGFAAQKNFAISQCTGDWILSLDADEELTPALQQEIRQTVASQPSVSAFYLKRRNLFLGRWIRRGGFYPDAKLRLFRRDLPAPPRFQDRPVHETITYNGPTATLNADLLHRAYPTLSSYIEHMDRYSSLGAHILVDKGRTSTNPFAFLGHILIIPVLGFKWNYVFRLGFLDGREGLLLHWYHACYTSWKYAKAWELARKPRA
ncbi:MAG: glycosyltransferase family 2 protein [Acidobacteriaceae bacterium]